MGKITVIQGEDRVIPLEIIRRDNNSIRRPFDITGWTKITIEFKKSNNSILSIDNLPAHGRKASGVYDEVTYTATNVGVTGNSIALVFNGVQTVSQIVAAWNLANPLNLVSHNSTTPTEVPPAGTLALVGGLDNYSKVTVSDVILGKMSVKIDNLDTNSLKVGPAQSIKIIIDFGAHDLGNRRIAMARNALDVTQEKL